MVFRRMLTPVVPAGTVKREQCLDEQPGQQHGQNRQRRMRGAIRKCQLFASPAMNPMVITLALEAPMSSSKIT
jgi:hypothetical protein